MNTETEVEAQWKRLISIARHKGFALAIGHPRSATFKLLEEELPKLADEDLILVAPSEIVKIQEQHPLPDAVTLAAPASKP